MTANPDVSGRGKLSLEGKRILILFPHIVTAGGALHYTFQLAKQLRCQGATVAILTLQIDRSMFAIPEGVELVCIDGPLTSQLRYWVCLPFWQTKINRAISNWQADVLIPQVFPSNWWGWFYKKRSRAAKVAWVCHEPSAFIHSLPWIKAINPRWMSVCARLLRPVLAKIDVSLAQQSDLIIANSQFTSGEVRRVYSLDADAVAYPGVELKQSVEMDRSSKPTIITVARLTRFKRIDFLLQVFRGVLKSYPSLQYHIVGTGEEAANLRQLVGEMGLEAHVVFHGAVDNEKLNELYSCASLFLHGSINEPFGMAPLEAIANGTPVIAHCSGGPQEFVNDGCGRLIISSQLDDWIDCVTGYLHLLFHNPALHEEVRISARRFEWLLSIRPAVKAVADLCWTPRCSPPQQ